jgi:hypothetical protein
MADLATGTQDAAEKAGHGTGTHPNMGMGGGAVPVNDHPPVDMVSRASKAMVEICQLDGL